MKRQTQAAASNMIRMTDLLTAASDHQDGFDAHLDSAMGDQSSDANLSKTARAEAARSRAPLTMTRAMVRADLRGMLRYYGTDPLRLPHYREELEEAEHVCAHCSQVERCKAWLRGGRKGDAPRLFCPNRALFEEMASDPFWTAIVPGSWHPGTLSLPLLSLLSTGPPVVDGDPPDLQPGRLQAFARAALKVDRLIDASGSGTAALSEGGAKNAAGLQDRLASSLRSAIETTENMSLEAFRAVFHVACCDRRLANRLCGLVEELSVRDRANHQTEEMEGKHRPLPSQQRASLGDKALLLDSDDSGS